MFFIYLIILLLPVYLIRIEVFELKTNLLDILLISFCLYWFFKRVVIEKQSLSKSLEYVFNGVKRFLLPISLILIGLITSVFQSSDMAMSLGIIKSWFILPVAFFIFASYIARTEQQKLNLIKAWFLSGLLMVILSATYYFSGEMTYDDRLKAIFSSPNHLAMYLAPALIIGVFMLANGKWQVATKAKMVSLSVAVISIGVVIFLTKSMGGMLAIVVSLLPFFYRQIKNNKREIITFLVLLFLVFSFLFLVLGKDFSERSSFSSRIMIWRSAIDMAQDNVVFGIGPGMFQEKYLEYQPRFEPYLEWAVPQPHNIFLAFWLQSGLLGLIGFMWLLVILFKDGFKKRDNEIVFLGLMLMIYFVIHGLFDNTYWKNDLAVMFWLAIVLFLDTKETNKNT